MFSYLCTRIVPRKQSIMKHTTLIKLIFILILATSSSTSYSSNPNNDSVRLSLLTCAPGEEIYSLFGHTAIRYEDTSRNIDVVFNYGLFSFNTPNFILRFALGETDYQLGAIDYERFAAEYENDNRNIWQQELNLSPKEKDKLIYLLEENYQPQNRIYRYNFFYDNCATRPRDKIEESINGKVIYPSSPADQSRTYREIVHEFTQNHPWSRFGIDLCLGSEADRPITRRQMMFAPFYLKDFFENAQIKENGNSRALISKSETLVDCPINKTSQTWIPTPFQSSLLLFMVVVSFTIYGIKRRKGLWGLDLALFLSAGIAGCILTFLALFSQHPTVGSNFLLIIFHPIHLIALPFIIHHVRKGKKCYYNLLNVCALTLFMMIFPLIPQKIDLAVVPLALCLLIRSASNLILAYNNKR